MIRRGTAVLVLAAALAGCGKGDGNEQTATPAAPAYIDPALIPNLRTAATAACLCTRDKGYAQRTDCWRDFDRNVARYRHSSIASACAEGSSAYLEFERAGQPDFDPQTMTQTSNLAETEAMTVMTEFPYGACSAEEVPAKKTEFERQSGRPGCG